MSRTVWLALIVIVTVGTTITFSHIDWFKRNEHVALWLEGIALILIFAWDRLDAQAEHKETMAQIEIARQQSQSVMNSERAWVTADLGWAGGKGHITYLDSPDRPMKTAAVELALELKNDGRTPAWVDNISAGMEIHGGKQQLEQPIMEYVEPLSAGKTRKTNLKLTCPGKPKMGDEILYVHITVNYRDIFESHEMRLEYGIEPLTLIMKRLGQRKVDFRSPDTWFKLT
jgi:hypothetical protein